MLSPELKLKLNKKQEQEVCLNRDVTISDDDYKSRQFSIPLPRFEDNRSASVDHPGAEMGDNDIISMTPSRR